MHGRYKLLAPNKAYVNALMTDLNIPFFVACALVNRGVTTSEQAKKFLEPNIDEDWGNPYDILGAEDVCDMLEDAIKSKKRILVFGDFDVDGISATAILTRGLLALGANVIPFLPDRFDDGYGIGESAIERVLDLDIDVLVSVDCGVANGDEVEILKEHNIQVAITDHHEQSNTMPKDVPLCDPKLGDACDDFCLAGCGVALKIIQGLGSRFGFPNLWRSYTDFACLGTIADMMPLCQQNRALVKDGIARISTNPRPSIAAILSICNIDISHLTSTNLSFLVVPRLNAAGRMGEPCVALDLLLSDDASVCADLAQKLDNLNQKRKLIEQDLEEEASLQAAQKFKPQNCLVLSGEGWHEGVKGIVASRMTDKFGVPCILFTIDGDEATGSGRSVGDINIFEAVSSTSDILTRFGGHKNAVGVTLPTSKLPGFEARINYYMDSLPTSLFEKTIDVDAVLSSDELSTESISLIDKMQPFGQDNPEPCFLFRGVSLVDKKAVGAQKNHFSCKVADGINKVGCICFNCKNIDEINSNNSLFDVLGNVLIEHYKNSTYPKIRAQKILFSNSCPLLLNDNFDYTCDFVENLFLKDGFVNGNSGTTCECDQDDAKDGCLSTFLTSEGGSNNLLDQSDNKAASSRLYFESLAISSPQKLEQEIIRAIIGDNLPHSTQIQVLDLLKNKTSCLAVMATGRGKSLIFQVYAALCALKDHTTSVFIYPLRALMADQIFHLQKQFSKFGIRSAVLNGACDAQCRSKIYDDLKNGKVDILMTTPEFLSFHAKKIADATTIGFVVVDEAHHIGMARAGNRQTYNQLGSVLNLFSNPCVLAVTATADDDIAEGIKKTLGINTCIYDKTSRDNLHVNDARGCHGKEDYLAHICTSGKKTVVYVNSRVQSVGVARRLRSKIPSLAPYIGFYNAGLNREERTRVEDLFRNGTLRVLVSTSAFGEGIDIPDIENVVLFHMPYSATEFNQMAGRAGRNGNDAWIHLLYGKADERINLTELALMHPGFELLQSIYKALHSVLSLVLDKTQGKSQGISLSYLVSKLENLRIKANEATLDAAISVFSEIGILSDEVSFDGKENLHSLSFVMPKTKPDLRSSVRFMEGQDQIEAYKDFCVWALKSDLNSIIMQVTHPIVPDGC